MIIIVVCNILLVLYIDYDSDSCAGRLTLEARVSCQGRVSGKASYISIVLADNIVVVEGT